MPENQQLYHNWAGQQTHGWSSIAEIIDFEGDMPDMDSAALIHEATRNLLDLVMEARETIKALHDLGETVAAKEACTGNCETCPAKESITDNYCPNLSINPIACRKWLENYALRQQQRSKEPTS